MKVLVTGGSGFIGSHLVDGLVHAGHDVMVIDHHKRDRKRFLHDAARYYKMSFASEEASEVLASERPDAVCHLAAQISVTRSVAQPLLDAEQNIVDSIRLLENVRRNGCGHFLFASSGGAIYGDHPKRPTPVIHGAKPISPYGVSKQAFEHYLDGVSDLRTAVLRMSNVYGPRQSAKGEASVIAIFIDRLLRGEPVRIYGDGTSTRDYLFVEDAVRAFIAALESPESGIFNVSSGVETDLVSLWETLRDVHGQPHPMKHAEARPGEVQRSVLDPSSAHEAFAWAASTSLERGLERTYEWFQETYADTENE